MDAKMEEQEALEQLQRELAAKEQELAALRQECEAMKEQLEAAKRREQVGSAIVGFKGDLERMLARWQSMKRQPYVHNHEWLLLYLYIELLHPGFERRLRAAVKNLTGTQYQLCLLIRLGFDSNKELGEMLGVAPQSIAKYKQRLRSRIIEKGLPTITWVLQFIHNI